MAEPNATHSLRLLVGVGLLSAVTAGIGVTAVKRSQAEPEASDADQMPFTVFVVVAAKDLPAGTLVTKETLAESVVTKTVPLREKPAKYVAMEDALLGKRLAKAYRAGEAFHPDDLTQSIGCGFPNLSGQNVISAAIGCPVAQSGVVGPGAVVDVAALVRVAGKPQPVTILADATVLAVDTTTVGGWPIYSFGVSRQQALLMELAKARGGSLLLVRRDAKDPRREEYKIDEVTKLLSEQDDTLAPAPPKAAPVPAPPGLALPAGTVPFVVEGGQTASGETALITPGGRVDLYALVRAGDKLKAFTAVANVLVVAVDTVSGPDRTMTSYKVTVAVDESQAAVLALAQAKRCWLTPLHRPPGTSDERYDVKRVTEVLRTLPGPEVPAAPAPRAR